MNDLPMPDLTSASPRLAVTFISSFPGFATHFGFLRELLHWKLELARRTGYPGSGIPALAYAHRRSFPLAVRGSSATMRKRTGIL